MSVESEKDIEALKRIGWIVSYTVQQMFQRLRIGMTTRAFSFHWSASRIRN